MTKPSSHYVVSIFAFVWFVLIVLLYFVTHKPFSPTLALNLARNFGHIFIAVSITAIAGGIGARVIPDMDIGSLAKLSLQSALGFGAIGILILIVGSVFGINTLYSWLGVLVLGMILWRDIIRWAKAWGDLNKIWQDSQRFGKLIGFGVFLIFLATLITALAPPLKFDALVYHLTLPKIYINSGHVSYVPDNMFWGMTQLGEMLYTLVVALGGIQTATVLGWMFGVLAMVGLLGYANKIFGSQTAWIAVASLLSGYTLAVSLAWGYVDWLAILFGLAVFVSLDMWRVGGGLKELVVAGIFTGMALGVKYTAGVLLLAGLGVILYHAVINVMDRNKILTNILFYLIPAITISLPWWVKNGLSTENPFYPFFFPAGAMDQFRLNFYQIPSWGNWQDIVFLPLRATFFGVEGAPGYNASIGPLLLALSPLAFLRWSSRDEEQRRALTTAAIITVLGLAVWVISGQVSAYLIQTRLFLSIFPAIAFLAGVGFNSISQITWSGVSFRKIIGALVLFILGLSVLEVSVGTINQGAAKVMLGLQETDEYLSNNLGWYGKAMNEIRDLPSDSEVLMLWEPRSLYCLPVCNPDEILDRWAHDRYRYGDPKTILTSWQEAGYTHLLFYQTGADFIREDDTRYLTADWDALEGLIGDLPLLKDLGGAYYLYTLEP
jgi:hypothetical protein